jgi:hypothetical protein
MKLPPTDFRRRNRLMFVIARGRYYNTCNAASRADDFLSVGGLVFPLVPGNLLPAEEQMYSRRNHRALEELKLEIEKEVNSGCGFANLKAEHTKAKDLGLFLKRLCRPINDHLPNVKLASEDFTTTQIPEALAGAILPGILPADCAVINERVYPLSRIDRPSFVRLHQQDFTFAPSVGTMEEMEGRFFGEVRNRLRNQVLLASDMARTMKKRLVDLNAENRRLERELHIQSHPYCRECGDIGFDTGIGYVYWIVQPHSNSATGCTYAEGQCAVGVELKNQQLSLAVRFLYRDSRNAPFKIHSQCACLGDLTPDPARPLRTLQNYAYMVAQQGTFYTAPNTSSHDDCT